VSNVGTGGLDELELSDEDFAFLEENMATETTAYETELNLRSAGFNLARQPVNCMMCGREVPFQRIQNELVRASNTGLTICVNCGRCEGRVGLHTFPVIVIDKQLGRTDGKPTPYGAEGLAYNCHYGRIHKGQNHLWIMDRNQQRHGWCATCNNARIEVNEVTKGGLDLKRAFTALAEKRKATRAVQRSEAMSIAEPYIKAGLAEPFALAIAAGTPAEEVMDLWESSWWKQYPADDSLIVSVLQGELTEGEARIINEFRGEHRELAEACIEKLVPVAWAQMLLDSGFEVHPDAVRHVLEGADPALIARIQNISVNEPPPPLGLKIEPKGGVTAPSPPSRDPTVSAKKLDAPPNSPTKKKVDIRFREDMLQRVMDEFGIVDREAFLKHAAAFDVDMNGYLNKGELEKAAVVWINTTKPSPRSVNQLPFFSYFVTIVVCARCGHFIENPNVGDTLPPIVTRTASSGVTCSACGHVHP
jgi:hypothetical protein